MEYCYAEKNQIEAIVLSFNFEGQGQMENFRKNPQKV